jgi:ubiquinone biosynthesis protein
MRLTSGVKRVRGFRRFGAISRVLIQHGLGDIADRLFKRQSGLPEAPEEGGKRLIVGYPSPKRIRKVLEELGPSFIKLGQLMSTRADVFPPEYIEELKKLQDRVPPIPFADIKRVIETELKLPIQTIFKEISSESMAAASVAQVHQAVLLSGDRVAVKVIRPGIERKITEDVMVMYYFAEKIEKAFEVGALLGCVNLVKEFERTVFKELDMFIEGGNIERFAKNFEDVEELYIGRVYWEYTSKSVLVMEHIDGIKMDQVEDIKAHDIDPKEVARIGLRSFSRQLMEFGLFHADPHPANTIVMRDGRVSLIDFGIIGYLDEEMMMQIANLFLGYAEHDYDLVMEALVNAGLIDEERVDIESFRIDLKDMSEPFYGRTLGTISVKDVYDQVIRLILKYRVRMPRDLLLLLKTFVQTESLGKILDSDASLLEVTKPYAETLLRRSYEAQRLFKSVERDVRTMGGHMRMFPKLLYDVLRQLIRGKQQILLRHTGFQDLENKFEKAVNRLTVGLVISASVIAGSVILNSSQKVMEFTVNFFGVHTISITALLGVIGYSLATVLGFWLIISIIRSGKL